MIPGEYLLRDEPIEINATAGRVRLRVDNHGDLVTLEEQDRSRWDAAEIASGLQLVDAALRQRRMGPYQLQAAVAALHAQAKSAEATDWRQIAALYGELTHFVPSPVVELNRAVAVAMRDGPAAGLELIDALLARGDLVEYHLAHAARADLCRRLGMNSEARDAYSRALELTRLEPERRFLEGRLKELAS